ncbi:MAG: hypothetical protein IIY21_00960 [Clostridiales bacterium]|nr:hypothetical protein [Clostridiales bacterium]MBQ1571461.1 hypothetical protein [Clostridiales bacterium]
MAEKKSTQFYHSWIRNLERLAEKDKTVCCDLMLSLLRHGASGEDLKMDSDSPLVFAAELLFEEYSETIDRDTDKYMKKCEQNKENVKSRYQSNTTVYDRRSSYTKSTDIDIDIDKDKDIDIDMDVRKRKKNKTKFHNFDERQYSDEQMDAIEKKLAGGG